MIRRAAAAVLGSVAVLLALSGCTTSAVREGNPGSALEIVRVDPSMVHSAAESVAGLHEGDFTLAGQGKSMLPVYTPGTVLVVHPTSYFMLRRGMAVVYLNHAGRRVAHVLTEESSLGWRTRGLNNADDDDDLVTSGNLVGLIRCAFVPDSSRRAGAGSFAALEPPAGAGIALLH